MIIREEKEFYYDPALMQTFAEATLLAVVVPPGTITDLDSHEDAIIERLVELVEESQQNGDDVEELIERRLHQIPVGRNARELALFIFNSAPYQRVLRNLEERIKERDNHRVTLRDLSQTSLSNQDVRVFMGDDESTSQRQAEEYYREYQQNDLWDYLEQLSMLLDNEE